jgi:predicted RNA methylase
MLELLALSLLVFLIVFWGPRVMKTTKDGAPFVAMEPEVVERVMEIAKVGKGDVFYELGSGDGRLVIAAAMRGAEAYGVEIDKLRVWYSRVWISLLRLKNAKIICGDIFKTDLRKADVVCLYLLQETNEKIQQKLEKQLKKGTRVISVAFDFPGWQPEKVDQRGTIYGPIYLYKR